MVVVVLTFEEIELEDTVEDSLRTATEVHEIVTGSIFDTFGVDGACYKSSRCVERW